MTQQDHPKFSLGEPPGRLKHQGLQNPRRWLILLAVLQLAVLGCLVVLLFRSPERAARRDRQGGVSVEELRRVALELQNKSLDGQAARAWETYLNAAPDSSERAEILFRIGKLYMQAEEFDRAAAALVRSEQAASGGQLREKIGPHLVNCLRRLGLYGEVGRELSRRVEVGADKQQGGQVLATLAGEPVTEADLDRMVQQRVDQMLSMQGAAGDEALRRSLLEQFARPDARRQLLQELLQTELMVRRARELAMDRDPEYLEARRFLEENLLASRFQDREVGKIEPTDVDLEAFLKAHEDRYRIPESLQVVAIQLKEGEDAAAVLKTIRSAEDFLQAARQRLAAGAAAGQEAPRKTVVRGREDPELGDVEPLFRLDQGKWTQQPHVAGQRRWLVLVESKSPSGPPSLAEARTQVEADYRARKRQELAEKLFRELMTRYDVKITTPQKTAAQKGKSQSPSGGSDEGQKKAPP